MPGTVLDMFTVQLSHLILTTQEAGMTSLILKMGTWGLREELFANEYQSQDWDPDLTDSKTMFCWLDRRGKKKTILEPASRLSPRNILWEGDPDVRFVP